ncbi:MAG: hypothetical protein BGN87_06415 [Rhizobiales bacterium 65-79]|jgi:hypothetical protein|nr:hypothetical protein [Hyphomicrobiales bacterium]OJU02823.1 MAG: hypothetical protein BGN87_06415 [Rhizobiales bacterium 65-79]
MDAVRACRVCGCTDMAACVTADGACYWVEPDLCSACIAGLERFPCFRVDDGKLCRQDRPGARWEPLGDDHANEVLAWLDGHLPGRLATCLADCIDTPLLKLGDIEGAAGRQIDIRLGAFNRDLADRAAGLLEEAGR